MKRVFIIGMLLPDILLSEVQALHPEVILVAGFPEKEPEPLPPLPYEHHLEFMTEVDPHLSDLRQSRQLPDDWYDVGGELYFICPEEVSKTPEFYSAKPRDNIPNRPNTGQTCSKNDKAYTFFSTFCADVSNSIDSLQRFEAAGHGQT